MESIDLASSSNNDDSLEKFTSKLDLAYMKFVEVFEILKLEK